MYNWELSDWPNFTYDQAKIEKLLFDFGQRVGRITGLSEGLSTKQKVDVSIEMMVKEAIKTSEIEGEYFSRKDVMSSIKKNIGVTNVKKSVNQKADGISELMVTVHNSFSEPLTEETLFLWHKMLMKGAKGINIGQWRSHSEPMQVISGSIGKEKVHFEAPPSKKVPKEMNQFINWYNKIDFTVKNTPIYAAIAHIYFESIHPFEDGNGRIGRAISEKVLFQGLKQPLLISLSRAIEAKRDQYYQALKKGQKSNDITVWLVYFLKTAIYAQQLASEEIEFTLKKTRFFDSNKEHLNTRQTKVIKRMLQEGTKGFEGGMSAKKYMSIAKTSKATATRDLQALVKQNIFISSIGGGRSTNYQLNLE